MSAELDHGRRLSLSQIVEMLLRPRSAAETVHIKTDQKNQRKADITGVALDGETLEELAERVANVSDRLHARLTDPFNGGPVAGEEDVPF